MITHGNISRLLKFLEGLRQKRIFSLRDFRQLTGCNHCESLWIECVCEACRLTRLAANAKDELLQNGQRLAELCSLRRTQDAFRYAIELLILAKRPIWANRMPMGREETYLVMSDDEYYCLSLAGLTENPPSFQIVEWWDRIAASFRSEEGLARLDVGRKGERLTLRWEEMRTGQMPRWQSVESNFTGYDILSCQGFGSRIPRLIEVKATEKPMALASFHVSRREWETAELSSERYYFYLWLLHETPSLAIVSTQEMKEHIPSNNGAGQWESIVIPYSSFAGRFSLVDAS